MDVEETKQSQQTNSPYYNKFFRYSFGILLILTIILVFYNISSLLTPIVDFISILATPLIFSLLLYYLLRPIVYFMERFKIPRYVSILIIYVIIALLLFFFSDYVGPILGKQITAIANISVEALENIKASSRAFIFRQFHFNFDYVIEQRLFNLFQQITTSISQNLGNVVGFVTRVATILAVIPFIVFYLLKDDQNFASNFLHHVPEDFGREVRKILHDIDHTFSNYINGLVLVSSCVGIMLFIGYLIIGLNYSLILSLIALVFMTIPFLGPFLAISPALLVALSHGPSMIPKVIVVFVIVQQIESNVLSPQIIGQRLNIHPLTIILLLLAAGSFYGLLGLILATPVYAASRVLIENLYKIYRLRHTYWK